MTLGADVQAPVKGTQDDHRLVSRSTVVNGQTLSEVLALPARSFTPVEPPLIVAVYDVENANGDEGSNEAIVPSGLNDTAPGIMVTRTVFRYKCGIIDSEVLYWIVKCSSY